uniref:Maf-like protein n=1 Tax=Panagrolaimus davidi TaxID=227884 RepID=A0A914P2W1_9BILA
MDVKWLLGEASEDPIIFVADNSEDRLVHFQRIGINPRLLLSNCEADKLYDSDLPPILVAKASAEAKAHDVKERLNREKETYDMIIGFHTVVAMDNKIIPKPLNRDEAFKILKQLNNGWHSIITGVSCLSSSQTCETFAVETKIKYGNIPDEVLDGYVETDEWMNQNATYDIYGKASAFIESTNGCFYNILGIPIFEVAKRIRHLMLDDGKSKPSLVSESALIQQNVEETISNENINGESIDPPSTETINNDNTTPTSSRSSLQRRFYENNNSFVATPTSSRSSRRRFTTPLPSQHQTRRKQNQASHVKESPASSVIRKDEYSSTFYRATGRPGLSDLRRAGIEVPEKQIDPVHSYKYTNQDDWG